jgi:endogenous inhibitor of DNA gyrase (YacG/DUF329 family)
MLVNCPQCGLQHEWNRASPWRPFCCERCKLIDLGDWFAERNAIPEDTETADDPDPTTH